MTEAHPETSRRRLGLALFALALLGFTTLAWGAVKTVQGSLVTVAIHEEDGLELWLPVPTPALRLALGFVPAPDLALEERRALELAGQILDQIELGAETAPFELVRVEDGEDLVVLTVDRDRLRIEVDDHHDRVRVDLPLSLARAALDAIGREAGSRGMSLRG